MNDNTFTADIIESNDKGNVKVTGRMEDPATEEYIEEKLQLIEDLGIELTYEQVTHIKSLKTEVEIDRYCRDLIWGK